MLVGLDREKELAVLELAASCRALPGGFDLELRLGHRDVL